MNDDDHKRLRKLGKLVKCERCGNRLPTDSEIGELCNRRKLESREYIQKSMELLERKGLAFCVCPERLWHRKPHLVAAVLAAKYPKMNWESPTGKNRIASWIIKQLASNSKKKALTAKERRTLYEFREKGSEILYLWGLEFPEFEIPLIVLLDNLLDNPLIKMSQEKPRTPADMDKFMRDVAENPSLLYMLLLSEITGHVAWLDEDPFGYDPGGMKEELYEEHPECQAILDGVVNDYGYDECVAELASYGFSPYLDGCEISYEEATAAMEGALHDLAEPAIQEAQEPDPFEKALKLQHDIEEGEASERAWVQKQRAKELDPFEKALKLEDDIKARMIAALKHMVTSLTSKTPQ